MPDNTSEGDFIRSHFIILYLNDLHGVLSYSLSQGGANDHEPLAPPPSTSTGDTLMKKIVLALALIVMGGASLSTANAATVQPATIGAAVTIEDTGLQL